MKIEVAMLIFRNFEADDLRIVRDAIIFTRGQVDEYYRKIAEKVHRNLSGTIWDEYREVTKPIDKAEAFFKKNEHLSTINMREEEFFSLMDAVVSSLVFYRKNLVETHRITKVDSFIELIKRVDRILSHLPKEANKSLFDKYYPEETKDSNEYMKKETNIFISYQDKDRDIACEIKRLLVSNSELDEDDVFVAHRDIPLAKEWRDDIINHLENCTHLIVLCTENYKSSAWGNQEVGYAMARRDVKIIPLFWEGTKRERFGFIETFQALPDYINEENLERTIKEILGRIGVKK